MLENKFKTPCWKVFWVVGKIVEREEFGLKEFVQATTLEIQESIGRFSNSYLVFLKIWAWLLYSISTFKYWKGFEID